MLLRNGRRSLSLHHAAVFRPLRPTPRFPLTAIAASQRPARCFGTQQQPARPTTTRTSLSAGRNLATSVDEHQSADSSKYDRLASSILPPYGNGSTRQSIHELRPFDPSSPLVLDGPMEDDTPRKKMNRLGVSGNLDEMLLVFDACLRVGKVDRAELILKRMALYNFLPGEELIFLYNRYLRTSLEQLRLHPDSEQAAKLHKWYVLNIRSKGLPQTAETVACMVKASLLSERSHSNRDALITHYMSLAPGEAGLHVLSMADILSDKDLAIITKIFPDYNIAPQPRPDSSNAIQPEAHAEPSALGELSRKAGEADQPQSMPEVLATPQKGFGLKTLKHTLSLFDEIPQNCDISTLPLRERREIQARLERDCIDAAVNRWREENESLQKMGLNTAVSHATLNSRLYDWQLALEARFKEEMVAIEAAETAVKKSPADYDRCIYGPFLRLSTPTRLAAVTILGALSSTVITGIDRGMPLSAAIVSLAKMTEEDIRDQAATQKKTAQKPKSRRMVMSPTPTNVANDKRSAEETSNHFSQLSETAVADKPWPVAVRAKVGAALLSALIETAKIKVVKEHPETKALVSQYQPAFSHVSRLKKGKKTGMILLNKELVNIMKREPQGDYLAKHLPMVVEPEPWQAFDKGGFLESRANLVRIKQGDKDQKLYSEAAIARGDMDQVFKGLDVLGKTPWRVNTPVLNVMLAAWNTGEALANLPALNPNIPIPREPEATNDPLAHRAWVRAVRAAENERGGMHSVRCFMNFQLEIARAFRNQTFYFPHNIDFRGRAYPLPTYLNHMGADHVRGLLRFANGKELGEEGLKWLKVHVANVFGFDKASLKERESFAMDNLVNIFDSANNPLDGTRWWLKAEDPWQCLATCFELKAALESPEPTKFVSHLPVHQDGTCNGLQHYAALGGDSWGARQVNLEPGDKPADVYSAVANIVKEHIAKDAESGNVIAVALRDKITRKVVKQTVMTNVYGVTFAGAKKQVCKQLDSLYPDLPKESGFDNIITSSYVATLVFKALSSMFRGAHDIQYWLGEIGGRVCRALSAEQLERIKNDNILPSSSATAKAGDRKTTTDDILAQFRATIVWTTPLRMPISQPYRKSGTRCIKTSLQDLSLIIPERSDPVHRRKQLQAFPPNFIHSLDATHMLLSALECHELGLDFAAVHDSFWTHASDVNTMNRVLRDAFIRIHEEDVVGRLAAEFEARYRGSIYLAKINSGTPVEKKITALRKKFKMSTRDELLAEYKRQTLLRSLDPEQVAEGKKMVTPASIFEEMSANESLAEPEDMEGLGLGSISDKEGLDLADDEIGESEQGIDDEIAAEAPEAEDEAAKDDSPGAKWMERLTENAKVSFFERTVVNQTKTKQKQAGAIQVWLPLTFPAIPEKGDFDVQRLKKSEYFFS
ncbi:DNA-directed RNA polymerase [Colletotrichum higginsianum IMI 349063]|uniref:DNA-directed RNA polymerase n=1 Tax=Colletotrichum higginsianum (strain IMI 349063) TaxID=759273 RepID=A0A1B7XS40_COLHI|nr:DNA-directed RNA polymerase [Colletotrichum higginsianum IMI 349063]OBR02593.1 DNA-directed RNA polymerase [Colletotrichum higginsianum IMI 349063]